VGDGFDALRAVARAHVQQTRKQKLVAVLAQLREDERTYLRCFQEAREKGERLGAIPSPAQTVWYKPIEQRLGRGQSRGNGHSCPPPFCVCQVTTLKWTSTNGSGR
jgi:hypothetical protein